LQISQQKALQKPKEAISKYAFGQKLVQDVKFGIVDSEYLKDFFYLIVIRYYESCRVYIESLQDRYSYFVYCNFVYLAQRWDLHHPCTPWRE
jgi:hypothetical protein